MNNLITSSKTNRFMLWLSLALFIFIISVIFGFISTNGGEGFIIIATALLSLAVLSVPLLMERKYFLFEPLTYVILIVFFSFFLKSFYIVSGFYDNPIVYAKLLFGLNISSLFYGSFILLLGLSCFSLGYTMKIPRFHIPKYIIQLSVSRKRFVFFSVITILVSYISFYMFVDSLHVSLSSLEDLSRKRFQGDGETAASRLDSISYVYYRLALLGKAPMYVLFYLKLTTHYKWRSLYGILLIGSIVINLIIPFFISNKAGILLPLTDFMVMAYVVNRLLNIKKILLILLSSLLVLSFIASVRGGDSLDGHSFYDKLFGDRYLMGITKNAHIINAVPDRIDYFYGETLIAWTNIFLPETMKFDSKAFTDLDYYIGRMVFDTDWSGIPPGVISEMYLNFGALGVAFGMLFIGAFLKWMHRSLFYHANDSPLLLILYAIIMVRLPVFLFNNGVGVTILKVLADTLIIFIFIFLVMKMKRT